MNPVDMDPGPGVLILTLVGFRDAFVLKLDTDALEMDKDKNVILYGMFNNTVYFDPGPGVLNYTSAVHFQEFIVKLNEAGYLVWAKQFGIGAIVYHDSHIVDVKTDGSGDIFLTGDEFSGTCDFDPGPAVYSLTALAG